MKRSRLIAAAATGTLVVAVAAWAGSGSKGTTKVGTVGWENSFADAEQRATKESKPILHLQMFGNLGDEFC